MRLGVLVVTSALLAGVLSAAAAAPASAAPARELAEKRVNLTASAPGMPSASSPGRQIKRAMFRVIYDHAKKTADFDVDVWLRGRPARNPDGLLVAGVGTLKNGGCRIEQVATRRVWATDGSTANVWRSNVPARTAWNCAVVALYDVDDDWSAQGAVPWDAKTGRLSNVWISPKLTLGSVQVLGRNQKQLRLVRKAPLVHQVVVRNRGKLAAKGVVITGKGKGVRVKKTKVGRIEPGQSATANVRITLKGARKKTRVRLTVRGSGSVARKTLRVKRVKAPARPRAGRWKDGSGTFSFRVKKGKITQFRGVNMRMTCSPPLSYPTYRNVTLGFPKTKVPRHGVVSAVKRYRKGDVWYTATLQARVVGGRLTQGKYRYSTAGSCSVTETFTARRR